jgi:acyl-CoA thioester hydrolase
VSVDFRWPVTVYWEDTDAGGIVYYANYLRFMERARTEWLRAVGIDQTELLQSQGLMFVVVEAHVRYRLPARYGDSLEVVTRVLQRRHVSLTFEQDILRRDGEMQQLLVQGEVRVACLAAREFKPAPLPERLVKEMQ